MSVQASKRFWQSREHGEETTMCQFYAREKGFMSVLSFHDEIKRERERIVTDKIFLLLPINI